MGKPVVKSGVRIGCEVVYQNESPGDRCSKEEKAAYCNTVLQVASVNNKHFKYIT